MSSTPVIYAVHVRRNSNPLIFSTSEKAIAHVDKKGKGTVYRMVKNKYGAFVVDSTVYERNSVPEWQENEVLRDVFERI